MAGETSPVNAPLSSQYTSWAPMENPFAVNAGKETNGGAMTTSVFFSTVPALLKKKLRPIICIGERTEDRKAGVMYNVARFQLAAALFDVEIRDPGDIVVAYEPVWAIGTGNVATPQQAEDMHEVIRQSLEKHFGIDTGSRVRILYGGSVNEDNIEGLIDKDQINGALIGGVSLDLDKFLSIINSIEKRER